MKLFIPLKRATLLLPSGPAEDPNRKHLFVVLSDPFDCPDGEKYLLLVGLSSVPEIGNYDNSCILRPGDHPFIKHDSFVFYSKARIENAGKILRGVREGKLAPYETVSPEVFEKICQGVVSSPFTPPWFLRYFKNQ